jgi:hypothetical protein
VLATAIDLDEGTASLDVGLSVDDAARAGLTSAQIERMASAFEHRDLQAARMLHG